MEEIILKPKKGQVLTAKIEDMAYGGKGIVKIPIDNKDYIIFISNTIVGQEVKFKIIKKKENYAEGRLLEIIKKSEIQKKRPFQNISGAPYTTLDINFQQNLKKKQFLT